MERQTGQKSDKKPTIIPLQTLVGVQQNCGWRAFARFAAGGGGGAGR